MYTNVYSLTHIDVIFDWHHTPYMWYLSSSLLLLYFVIEWNVNKSVKWKNEFIPSSAANNIIKVTSRKIKMFRSVWAGEEFPAK